MKRVLIIDDDANLREAFLAALSDRDYDLEAVGSGAMGVESARRQKPDLIFLDSKMPVMNGAEALMHLTAVCPGVPVYVVTALYAEFLKPLKEARARGLSFDLARKPLTLAEIRAIADGALRKAVDTNPPHH